MENLIFASLLCAFDLELEGIFWKLIPLSRWRSIEEISLSRPFFNLLTKQSKQRDSRQEGEGVFSALRKMQTSLRNWIVARGLKSLETTNNFIHKY